MKDVSFQTLVKAQQLRDLGYSWGAVAREVQVGEHVLRFRLDRKWAEKQISSVKRVQAIKRAILVATRAVEREELKKKKTEEAEFNPSDDADAAPKPTNDKLLERLRLYGHSYAR